MRYVISSDFFLLRTILGHLFMVGIETLLEDRDAAHMKMICQRIRNTVLVDDPLLQSMAIMHSLCSTFSQCGTLLGVHFYRFV